jgi:hypothetical protein
VGSGAWGALFVPYGKVRAVEGIYSSLLPMMRSVCRPGRRRYGMEASKNPLEGSIKLMEGSKKPMEASQLGAGRSRNKTPPTGGAIHRRGSR